MTRRDRKVLVTRTQLASTAARLMVQDGMTDMGLAKKKAARQLGIETPSDWPDDGEVEAELRLYRALYQSDGHAGLLCALRETARDVMRLLSPFRTYLTGSVLEGTAGEQSDIDIQVFVDSAKEVEIFLLDQGIDFDHAQPRSERAEAVLVISTDVADVNLIVYPAQMERVSFKYRDGRPRERIRLDALTALLQEMSCEPVSVKYEGA